jgi:hypothetical protein
MPVTDAPSEPALNPIAESANATANTPPKSSLAAGSPTNPQLNSPPNPQANPSANAQTNAQSSLPPNAQSNLASNTQSNQQSNQQTGQASTPVNSGVNGNVSVEGTGEDPSMRSELVDAVGVLRLDPALTELYVVTY